jgi:hypothetical protein
LARAAQRSRPLAGFFYAKQETKQKPSEELEMAIQIADSMIADKVDRLAKATGLSMTAVVELALDLWLSEMSGSLDQTERMTALMEQLEHSPGHPGAREPIN